jgi:hypothetical protein
MIASESNQIAESPRGSGRVADQPPRTENPRFQLSEHIRLFARKEAAGYTATTEVAAASHNAILVVMTWVVGTPTMFGYAFGISDLRVTLGD